MPDIFISYARSTATQAAQIAEALRALGHDVWRDDELPAHRAYSDVIEEQVRAARAVVVIWSAEAAKSHWVRAEADVAREAGTLVQLSIDGAVPPMPFNQIQCADMKGWSGAASAPGWQKVLASVDALVGGEAPQGAAPRIPGGPALALPDKPSIAVLPFTDMTGSNDHEHFADGVVDEIATALSRFPTLFVIANNSTLAYRGETRPLGPIAHELGVRYLLEGGVRISGDRVRVSVKLTDAIENLPVWAERFDGRMEDVFTLQETLANAVAGQIEPSIEASEIRRVSAKPTEDLGAYDLYLRAIQLRRRIDKDSARQAIGLLDAALARDPDFGLALALAAHIHSRNFLYAWSDDPAHSREIALQLAGRALQSAENDPRVLAWAAWSMSNCGGDVAMVESLTRRALEINPNSADLWFFIALYNVYAGRADLALTEFETVLRLDPRSPDRPLVLLGIGLSLFLQRRFEEAILPFRESGQLRPNLPSPRVALAACFAHLGRAADARAEMAAVDPAVLPLLLNLFSDPQSREFVRASMALAGADI